MVIRKISGLEGDEVRDERRRLCKEEFNELYSSPDSFRMMKSRRMRWAEHVAHVGKRFIQGSDGQTRVKENKWKTLA